MKKSVIRASLALATAAFALGTSPAQAVVTTFAAFQPVSSAANIALSSGTLHSGGAAAAPVDVRFSFVGPGLSQAVDGVIARFSFSAPLTGNAMNTGGQITQATGNGSFSFISTSDITYRGRFYAAGSNLVSGVFGNATLSGEQGRTTAVITDSTGAGNVVALTSDFYNFSTTQNRDFAFALTALRPLFNVGANGSVGDFRATSSGNISIDPVPPLGGPVPEPATWGLMFAGFTMMGTGLRRRRRAAGRSVLA